MPHATFILFPKFQMLAYVLATETLRIANKCAGKRLFSWETRSANRQAVLASNNASVIPDCFDWAVSDASELVLLCAGYDPPSVLPAGLKAFMVRAERNGATLGGVDTGTIILARLGLLNGRQAVLHHEAEAGFREEWPEIAVSDGIYCLDDRRLTAAGGMATGDAMLAWIAKCVSGSFADAVAEAMAHGAIRTGSERQRIQVTSDPILQKMKELMTKNLAAPLPVSAVARRLGLSDKQLRLRCQKGLGQSPASFYLRMRLQEAIDLLRNTEMNITEISIATGFATLAGFSRTFKNQFKTAPSNLRAPSISRERRAAQ